MENKLNSIQIPNISNHYENIPHSLSSGSETLEENNERKENTFKDLTIFLKDNDIKKISNNFAENQPENSFIELIDIEQKFDWKIFIEFCFYLVLFTIFGPLFTILLLLIKRKNLAYNLSFIGSDINTFMQNFHFVIGLAMMINFVLSENYLDSNPIIMIYFQICLKIFNQACVFATIGNKKINYLKKYKLNQCEKHLEQIGYCWINQEENALISEIKQTIFRCDVDNQLFKLKFLLKINEKYEFFLKNGKKFKNEKNEIVVNDSKKNFESFLNLTDNNSLYYSGEFLLKFILLKIKKKLITTSKIYKISILISGICIILPVLSGVIMNQGFINLKIEFSVIFHFIVSNLMNFILISKNLFTLLSIFNEYIRFFYGFAHLSNLISPKKDENRFVKKVLPTIDLFDEISLKSWGTLHLIIRNYGKKFKIRADIQVVFYIFFFLILATLVIISLYDIIPGFKDKLMFVSFFQLFFLIFFILHIISKSININYIYQKHILILKEIKSILTNMSVLHNLYFNNNKNFLSENEVCKLGVEKLKNDDSYLIKKNLKIIVKSTNALIEDIKYNFEVEPFKVLGIPATQRLQHGIFALFASLFVSIIKTI